MPSEKEPTPKDFLVWLNEAAKRLAKQRPWPIGAKRFEYFESEVCWNLSRPEEADYYDRATFSMDDFESSYKSAHESGDPEAIFDFAEHNREALTRPWVVRQLTEWRLIESPKSERQFNRFMQVLWSRQGKRKAHNMIGIIKRDQRVYKAFLQSDQSKPKKVCISDLAQQFSMSQDSVKDVLKFYGQFYERWRKMRDTRIYLSFR